MSRYLFFFSALIFFLSLSFDAFSQAVYCVDNVPNDHLQNAADYVSNPDGIISEEAEALLNQRIASLESVSTAELAVVLLSSVGSDDIDDFATRLFTAWGLGKKNDNGLLFLLVYDQSQMVFRTGYGLEGALPDAILARIIRDDVAPRLKKGDFDGGVFNGINKVCTYLENPEILSEILQLERERAEKESAAETRRLLLFYLFLSFFIFVCYLLYFYHTGKIRSNHLRYTKLNRVKISLIIFTVFFPVLMIFFAIYYFITMRRLRNTPLLCPVCGKEMKKLSEIEDNTYLTQGQRVEEELRSVDYDVWLCPEDGETLALPFNNESSTYSPCPHCFSKAYIQQNNHIIKAATTFSKGKGERTYTCKNCGKTDIKPYVIPMIILSSSSNRSGGFGGGSSSRGGSWGGGRTGGGGARGGW